MINKVNHDIVAIILMIGIVILLLVTSTILFAQSKLNNATINFDINKPKGFISEYYVENTLNMPNQSYRLGLGAKMRELRFFNIFRSDVSLIGYTDFTTNNIFNPSFRWRLDTMGVKSIYFYRLYFQDEIFAPSSEHSLTLSLGIFDLKTTIRDNNYDVYLNTQIGEKK